MILSFNATESLQVADMRTGQSDTGWVISLKLFLLHRRFCIHAVTSSYSMWISVAGAGTGKATGREIRLPGGWAEAPRPSPRITVPERAQPAPSNAAHGRARPTFRGISFPCSKPQLRRQRPPDLRAAPSPSAPPQGRRSGRPAAGGGGGAAPAPGGAEGPALPLPNLPGSGGSAVLGRRAAARPLTAAGGQREIAQPPPPSAPPPRLALLRSAQGGPSWPGVGRLLPASVPVPVPLGSAGLRGCPPQAGGCSGEPTPGGKRPRLPHPGPPHAKPASPQAGGRAVYLFKISPRSCWSKLMQNKCLPLIDWFF